MVDMSIHKQLLLLLLILIFLIKGPFSSDTFTLYIIYSGFITTAFYIVIFKRMYFVYYNLIGEIKSILLTGSRAVTYGAISLLAGIVFAMTYSQFDTHVFLMSLPIGALLSFWVYRIGMQSRETKKKI